MPAIITTERPDTADARVLIAELEAQLAPLYPRESRHGYSVLIYGITLRRHSRALLAGIQKDYRHRVSTVNLDARHKHSGMTWGVP